MAGMIGWFQCEDCGFQYVYDPEQMRIYYSEDCDHYLINALCKCGRVVEDDIDLLDLKVLSTKGVKIISLNDKFTSLTELEINNWNVDKELAEYEL